MRKEKRAGGKRPSPPSGIAGKRRVAVLLPLFLRLLPLFSSVVVEEGRSEDPANAQKKKKKEEGKGEEEEKKYIDVK